VNILKNYDDVDLAIVAIVCLGIVGMIVGATSGNFATAGWSFAGACVAGIAGLAGRGKIEKP
jgi:hypothetical protein